MQRRISIISPEIKEILGLPDKNQKLKELFSDFHPRDIFELCEDLEAEENAQIIIALGRPLGIEFFQYTYSLFVYLHIAMIVFNL